MDAATVEGRDDPGDGGEHERSWRAAAGLIGVLCGLVLVVWVLSLTTGDANPADRSDVEPTEEERLQAPTTTMAPAPAEPEAEIVENGSDGGTGGGEPFSELEGRLMYLSGRHVAVVDLASGAAQQVRIKASGSVPRLTTLEMLTDGERTVGVSSAAGELSAVLLASGAQLVPAAQSLVDYWVISRPDGPDGIIQMNAWQDYGVLTGELRAPQGSELIAVRGGGAVVTPPAGGTYLPTLDGFATVSEHRVLAASAELRIEQRCDERLECAVVAVDTATGQAVQLPEDFVAELAAISVSPDNRWLLNNTSPTWLLDRHTRQLRLLDGGGYGPPQWSGDSTWVAWMTSDRTPTLVVARLEAHQDGRDWFAVELAGLGAEPSPGSSFLLDTALKP